MPKTKISEYSTTNSDNTDIENINIAEGCAPSGINNAIRELMVHLKEFQTGASGDAFTFAGGTLMSGTNTISGAAIISGNINSSGSANTFSGGVVHSGTNTFSSSVIMSGNINSSGTNTFSGSNVMSFSGGSSASPSIYFASDTNTGIFSPAADTIAFTEGGAEAMRIDSDGDVGIGTTSPSFKVDVIGASTPTVRVDDGAASGTRTAGRLLLGASSTLGVSIENSVGGFNDVCSMVFKTTAAAGTLTERARITSDGTLLVGCTGGGSSGNAIVTYGSGGDIQRIFSTQASSASFSLISMLSNATTPSAPTGTLRVNITTNGGIANYQANDSNLSDRREKTNFAPASSYLDKICAIPVQTFNYIDQNLEEDGGLTLGVVAQDVQAVAPELVLESNWGTEEEPKMRLSIYQTDLQYALMKCVQEQQALITQLQADVAALKGTA